MELDFCFLVKSAIVTSGNFSLSEFMIKYNFLIPLEEIVIGLYMSSLRTPRQEEQGVLSPWGSQTTALPLLPVKDNHINDSRRN